MAEVTAESSATLALQLTATAVAPLALQPRKPQLPAGRLASQRTYTPNLDRRMQYHLAGTSSGLEDCKTGLTSYSTETLSFVNRMEQISTGVNKMEQVSTGETRCPFWSHLGART